MMSPTEYCLHSLLTILIVGLLAACGGGGGGSPTAGGGTNVCVNGATNYPTCTLPAPKPVITSLQFTQIPAIIDKDAAFQITAVYTGNVTSLKSEVAAKCNNVVVPSTLTLWSMTASSATSSVTTITSFGARCTTEVTLIVSGPDGDSLPYKSSYTWSVKDAPITGIIGWWPPKTITPMGVTVRQSDLKQLPTGCLSFVADCFKQFVKDGKAVVIATTQTMLGLSSPTDKRSVVTVGYLTPSGKPQLTMFFADTGEVAVTDVIEVNVHDPFDWLKGNEQGYLWKRSNDVNCWQWKWYYNPSSGKGLFWGSDAVSCPG